MRALWSSRTARDPLSDALALLVGWSREDRLIKRTLVIDDAQHAALAERMKIAADVLHLRPEVRRLGGHTQIKIAARDGDTLTEREVTLAARIEDVYRSLTGDGQQ
jgi:pterin-4a-carbinolamine dehydratase